MWPGRPGRRPGTGMRARCGRAASSPLCARDEMWQARLRACRVALRERRAAFCTWQLGNLRRRLQQGPCAWSTQKGLQGQGRPHHAAQQASVATSAAGGFTDLPACPRLCRAADRGAPRARPRAQARRPLSPAAAAACTYDPLARTRAAAASAAAALPGLCQCMQRRFPPVTRGRPPYPALVGGDSGEKEMLLSCFHAATWHAAAEPAAAAPLELCREVSKQGPLLAH